jgi:hypothetical protein
MQPWNEVYFHELHVSCSLDALLSNPTCDYTLTHLDGITTYRTDLMVN